MFNVSILNNLVNIVHEHLLMVWLVKVKQNIDYGSATQMTVFKH